MEVNAIYEGDNLEILSKFPDKSVDLIYADPPFFSNKHYEVIWDDGAEIRSFQDRWKGGIEHYITWMEPRLRECHRVLKDTGSMYLHCDLHANAHLRILMDKIFDEKNFRNEIVWYYSTCGRPKNAFPSKHDTIFFYAKSSSTKFYADQVKIPYTENYIKTHFPDADEKGKKIRKRFDAGKWRIYQADEGMVPNDVWEIPYVNSMSSERLGYPTQKPLKLLEPIINASSKKGDIVLDPFCGCGTTLVAAQKLNRRWIGIDVSPTACKLMKKRLQKECSINALLVKGDIDLKYIQKLPPFEFQNWVVVDKFYGKVSDKKSGDMGIDGFTPQVTGGYPIQVKQSEGVGRNVIDNFETAMDRVKKNKGYIAAYSFGKGAYEEVARVKNDKGLEIILRTVQDLLDGKVE